jgi:hypothetical protein
MISGAAFGLRHGFRQSECRSTASACRPGVGGQGMLGSRFPEGLPAFGDGRQLRDEAVGFAFRTRVLSDAELTLESKPLQSSGLVCSGDPLAFGATVDRIQIAPSIRRTRVGPMASRSITPYYVRWKGFSTILTLICANG